MTAPCWVEIPPVDGHGPGLRLVLPYPPSANRYWRWVPKMGNVPSADALGYRAEVKLSLTGMAPLLGDIVVTRCAVFRPRKVGDLINRLKVLEDSLQGLAYLDDGQIVAYRQLERHDDAARPRVELELYGERRASGLEVKRWRDEKAATSLKRKMTLAKNRAAR